MTSISTSDSPQRARARNRRFILDVVRDEGSITRANLGSIIKLSKSAIKEICDDLIRDQLLEEFQPDDFEKRTPGRPALSLRVTRSHGDLLGIDIGADKVIARSATLAGDTLVTKEIRTRREKPDRDYLLSLVARAISATLGSSDPGDPPFRTVVVSTPGVVDPVTQCVSLAPQIRDWEGTNLRTAVAELIGIDRERVFVESQTGLSVLAESAAGAAKGLRHVLYVQIGIGIGGGLIVDGRLYAGSLGAAGELGYLPHNFGDMAPAGSGIGAWEWAAGGRAWARHGREAALEPGGARLLALAKGVVEDVDAEIVLLGVREGDAAARDVFECLTGRLAVGIASAICVLNPECVLIAGGLSKGGSMILDAIKTKIAPLVPIMPEMRLAAFGGDGGVTGAILRASRYAFDTLNPMP